MCLRWECAKGLRSGYMNTLCGFGQGWLFPYPSYAPRPQDQVILFDLQPLSRKGYGYLNQSHASLDGQLCRTSRRMLVIVPLPVSVFLPFSAVQLRGRVFEAIGLSSSPICVTLDPFSSQPNCLERSFYSFSFTLLCVCVCNIRRFTCFVLL